MCQNNELENLFTNNQVWRDQITDQNPDFFLDDLNVNINSLEQAEDLYKSR